MEAGSERGFEYGDITIEAANYACVQYYKLHNHEYV